MAVPAGAVGVHGTAGEWSCSGFMGGVWVALNLTSFESTFDGGMICIRGSFTDGGDTILVL